MLESHCARQDSNTHLSWPANAGHPGDTCLKIQKGAAFTFEIRDAFNWMARTPAGHDKWRGKGGSEAALFQILLDSTRLRFRGDDAAAGAAGGGNAGA